MPLVRYASPESHPTALALLAAGTVLLITACTGTLVPVTPTPGHSEPSAAASESPSPSTETAAPSAEASPTASVERVKIDLAVETAAGAEDFRYVQTALEAPAGSTINLVLSNMTNPSDEVGHNWVLVMLGQEETVLASATAAGDDGDWLDETDPGIIASSRLIEGGARDIVAFDAPPSGRYVFLCTFPEHFAGGMKGTLTIH